MNVCGAFKNKFAVVFWTADPCLKNLIIFLIASLSSTSLALNLNENAKGLSVGPWNKSSKFGFMTAPLDLDRKSVVPVAASVNLARIADWLSSCPQAEEEVLGQFLHNPGSGVDLVEAGLGADDGGFGIVQVQAT